MRSVVLFFAAAVLGLSTSIHAREAGDISIQIGAAMVDPDASSSELALNGSAIAGSSANAHTDTQLGIHPSLYVDRCSRG